MAAPFVPNIRYPDLGSIFTRAAESSARIQQMQFNQDRVEKAADRQLKEQSDLRSARGKASSTGDTSELARLAPKEVTALKTTKRAEAEEARAVALQPFALDVARIKAGSAQIEHSENVLKFTNTRDMRTLTELHGLGVKLQQETDPQRRLEIYQQDRPKLLQLGQQGVIEIDPRKLPSVDQDPQAVQQFMQDDFLDGFTKDYSESILLRQNKDEFSTLQNEAANSLGYNHAGVAIVKDRDAFNAEVNRRAREKAPKKGTTVITGDRVPAPKPVATAAAKGLVLNKKTRAAMDIIRKLGDPSRFLTLQGRVKGKALQLITYVGVDARNAAVEFFGGNAEKATKFLKEREVFRAALLRIVFPIRKDITGVAGGEKEMARIEGMVMNLMQDPTTFESAFELMDELNAAVDEINKEILREGFNVDSARKLTPEQRDNFEQQAHQEGLEFFRTVDPDELLAGRAQKAQQPRPQRTVGGETREWDGTKWVPING